MLRYLVKRLDDTVEVLILPNKNDGKYSFVNLTKGHICACKFDSVKDALKDMDEQIKLGKVISYSRVIN